MGDYNMGSPKDWNFIFWMALVGVVAVVIVVAGLVVWLAKHITWVP